MWSDNESEIDLLRFGYLSTAVIDIIRSPRLLPTTVGVFGDWGSGKSTLLKMIDRGLTGDNSVVRIQFSGWLFEGYDDAKSALMGSILDAIQERNAVNASLIKKTLDLINRLRTRVNWLQFASISLRIGIPAALGQPHLAAGAAVHAVAEKILHAMSDADKNKRLTTEDIEKLIATPAANPDELRKTVREFRMDFAELLKASNISTLVVFIDDLDRCLPDTVIATLEAIRLFLFVEGTVFILGADERLVEYAVRQRFPELPGTRAEVGRDYLEKLVQIPVRIPPLSGAEIHSYMNLLFAELRLHKDDYTKACAHVEQFIPTNLVSLSFDIATARSLCAYIDYLRDFEGDLDFVTQITDILAPGMQGNPRRTKRFLNMLLLRLSLSKARGLDLQRSVLAKLMLLEYIKPEFFRQLALLQANHDGQPADLKLMEEAVHPREADNGADEQNAPSQLRKSSSTVGGAKAGALSATVNPPEIPSELQPWLADDWIPGWLQMNPHLGSVDLRPYFYVAHDKVGALDIGQSRLTPSAAEVLNRLLDPQSVTQKIGLKHAESLNASDATAVFEALAQRVRQAGSDEMAIMQARLFEFVQVRPLLLPQLISLYGTLSVTKIPLSTPLLLLEMANQTPSEQAARTLFTTWAACTYNSQLAIAARQAAQRPSKVP